MAKERESYNFKGQTFILALASSDESVGDIRRLKRKAKSCQAYLKWIRYDNSMTLDSKYDIVAAL